MYFLLIFLGRLAVGCWFLLTGVSVDIVVALSWLSGVGCRVLIDLIDGCICRWRLLVPGCRVSVVEC